MYVARCMSKGITIWHVSLVKHIEVLQREVQQKGEVLIVPLTFYDSCFAQSYHVLLFWTSLVFVLFPRSASVMATPRVFNPEDIRVWTDEAELYSQLLSENTEDFLLPAFFPKPS